MSPDPASHELAASRDRLLALVVWIVVQAIVLLAAWRHVDLTARGPDAREVAGRMLLIAHMLTSAALFPGLVLSFRQAILACAIAFPFGQIAAMLEETPGLYGLLTFAELLLFMAALACWHHALPKRRWAQRAMAGILVFFTAGLPLLWYLSGESQQNPALGEAIAALSPVMQAANEAHRGLLILLAIHATAGALAVAAAALAQRSGVR